MHRFDREEREILRRVLDIRGYDSDAFDPEILNELEADEEYKELLIKHAADILSSEKFLTLKTFIQHGNVTVFEHCIHVALCAIKLNRKLGINAKERQMVRGALLHDYFLYDWHDKKARRKLHGFYHPGEALKNAERDFDLTKKERNIINQHMFPLTITKIPTNRESWVVSIADKWCSLVETVKMRKPS